MRKQVAAALAKEELKKTIKGDTHSRSIDLELGERPQAPTPVRYRTNDTSYEALAAIGWVRTGPEGASACRKPLPRNDQWKAPTPDLEGHRQRLREAFGNTLSDELST